MTEFWLVNTNDTYRPETKQYMLDNQCICAQYEPKVTIDLISPGDEVFIYENERGIIANGIADGEVIISDYDGCQDEQHEMRLRNFTPLREPIAPSEITRLSRGLDGVGVFYARTVGAVRTRTGMALHQLARERS